MSNKPKYPELHEQLTKLNAEKAELEKVVNPLREKRDALVASMAPLEKQARDLADEIKKYKPRLAELDTQISALARAMGGKSTNDGVTK